MNLSCYVYFEVKVKTSEWIFVGILYVRVIFKQLKTQRGLFFCWIPGNAKIDGNFHASGRNQEMCKITFII